MIPSARVLRDLIGDTELRRDASPALANAFVALRHALAKAEHATAKRDAIEADLMTRVDYPRVWIPDGTSVTPHYLTKAIELDQLVAEGTMTNELGQQLRDELQLRQAAWQQAADDTGLPSAIQNENAAAAQLFRLTDAFFVQPITSTVDATLFLVVIIACGEPGPNEAREFPWRELRKLFTATTQL